ncbi:carbohydrate ABC transporter permease [Microbacterium sp. NPDC076911]|uniref:carbohydrate ABC transporter permease n=1 Tax=Microbacterium sp. NPDC076911 TaxID=3154958 RepID=UPI0034495D4E
MTRLRATFGSALLEILLLGIGIAFIFPVYVLFVMSFKTKQDIAVSAVSPPTSLYLDNYIEAWREAALAQALFNSAIVTSLSMVFLVALGSMAAYGLVRATGKWGDIGILFFLLGITIPLQLGMVPLYQTMRDLGLLQSYTSLIIFHTGSLLPITVFLYAGFIRAQDRSYEEAAYVDGASTMQTFTKIVFPLLRPVTGTVIVLNAIHVWNDFLTPLLYLGGTDKRTLPVAIFAFKGEYATDWGIIFAGLAIAIIPIVIVFFVLQKYIIKGFSSGLKG